MKKFLFISSILFLHFAASSQVKISQLPAMSGSNADSTVIAGVQSGVTVKIPGYRLKGSPVDTSNKFVNAVTFPNDSTAIVCKGSTCVTYIVRGAGVNSVYSKPGINNNIYFQKNGVEFTVPLVLSVPPFDSTAFFTMVQVDSFHVAFCRRNGDCDTLYGIVGSGAGGCVNGVEPGTGLVTQVGTSRVFNVTASKFIIECSSGGTDATSITIPAISDTPRIDVIYVDNTNTVKQYTGIESYTPIPHTLSSTELALAYINVYPDSIVVTPVTPVSVFNNIGGKAFQNTSITYGGQTAGPWLFTGSASVTIEDGNNVNRLLRLKNTSVKPSEFDFVIDSLKFLYIKNFLKNNVPIKWDSAGNTYLPILAGVGDRPVSVDANGKFKIGSSGGGVTQGALDDTAAAIRMTIPLAQVVNTGNSFYGGIQLLDSDSTTVLASLTNDGGQGLLEILNHDHLTSTVIAPSQVSLGDANTGTASTVGSYSLTYNTSQPGNLTVTQVPSFSGTGDVTVYWPDKRDGTGARKDTLATLSDLQIKGSYSNAVTSATTVTVTIGSTQTNNTYSTGVTSTSLIGAVPFYVTNKTTTTFDVVFTSAVTGTLAFDWQVFPNP